MLYKLINIVQYTLESVVDKLFDPVKALENEQRKAIARCEKVNANYIKSHGDLAVQMEVHEKLISHIEAMDGRLNFWISKGEGVKARECAVKLLLLKQQYVGSDKILTDTTECLEVVKQNIYNMKLNISNNEIKLKNLKMKQNMNNSYREVLKLFKLGNDSNSAKSFEGVERQLDEDNVRIQGEGKAIQQINVGTGLDTVDDLDVMADKLLAERTIYVQGKSVNLLTCEG